MTKVASRRAEVDDRPLKASVCICSYNGADRIRSVIEAVALQNAVRDNWEILVVDNASTDGTGAVADKILSGLLPGSGRVIREPRPGLSYARARAATDARGEILCFLDDDNIPAPTFVTNAIAAFITRPKAGVIGGRVLPKWEIPPTRLAQEIASFALAICDLGEEPKQVRESGGGIVGAGMCIRKDVF